MRSIFTLCSPLCFLSHGGSLFLRENGFSYNTRQKKLRIKKAPQFYSLATLFYSSAAVDPLEQKEGDREEKGKEESSGEEHSSESTHERRREASEICKFPSR